MLPARDQFIDLSLVPTRDSSIESATATEAVRPWLGNRSYSSGHRRRKKRWLVDPPHATILYFCCPPHVEVLLVLIGTSSTTTRRSELRWRLQSTVLWGCSSAVSVFPRGPTFQKCPNRVLTHCKAFGCLKPVGTTPAAWVPTTHARRGAGYSSWSSAQGDSFNRLLNFGNYIRESLFRSWARLKG